VAAVGAYLRVLQVQLVQVCGVDVHFLIIVFYELQM
jgi:hypothetical protein